MLWPIAVLVLATATRDSGITFVALLAAETLAWAGVPAIGAAALGAAGVLAHQGTLHLWAVIVIGTIGAELGGLLGWQLGHRVARAGLDKPGRFAGRRAQAVGAGERYAPRWGPLIVFFVPSWVSGAIGMEFGRFARWNLLAAFLWVLASALGAYGLSSAVTGGSLADSLVPLLIAAAAFGAIVYAFVRWRRRRPRSGPESPEPGERVAG